eukprot:sb/3475136/
MNHLQAEIDAITEGTKQVPERGIPSRPFIKGPVAYANFIGGQQRLPRRFMSADASVKIWVLPDADERFFRVRAKERLGLGLGFGLGLEGGSRVCHLNQMKVALFNPRTPPLALTNPIQPFVSTHETPRF